MRIDLKGTQQQRAMKLAEGPVAITCVSLPELNGSYAIDAAAQNLITGVASAISAGLGLPSGEETFNWSDAGGNPHSWPAPQFTQFAKAVMQFVYQCAQVAQGHGDTLPSLPPLVID